MSVQRDLAHLSDEAIVVLVARAEESALAELYDRYGAAAYALARRVVRDPELAEDAVQEAFLAVWRDAPRSERLGRPLGTIKSQMFAALSNLRQLLDPTREEESWKAN